jgi:hypothetical protein
MPIPGPHVRPQIIITNSWPNSCRDVRPQSACMREDEYTQAEWIAQLGWGWGLPTLLVF